jgi:P-type conjugative transfer ATPase TrbB
MNAAAQIDAEAGLDVQSSRDRIKKKLIRDLGPDVLGLFSATTTIELMLNADGRLWIERLGGRVEPAGVIPLHRAEAIIRSVAGYHGKEARNPTPLLEAEFPLEGARFAAQLPPVVAAPTFAIRKRAIAIFALEQYLPDGAITQAQLNAIHSAIAARRNILVIGGAGSGKTTLVNAIINGMVEHGPDERLVIIEDTGEIQCAAANFIQYRTSAEVSMTALLKATLRMRPDRILVGEVRGPEALDLLMAWNTGHEGGAATLHANNASAGLTRLSTLINMHPDSPDPLERDRMIGEAVHLIVHIARTPQGQRKVVEVLEVGGFAEGLFGFQRAER